MRFGNKGFSLVEVIVSLAIMTIVGGAVGAFVIAGNNSYLRGNTELTLQEEAQLAANQMIDMIIDVEKGITMTTGTGKAFDMAGNEVSSTAPVKELRLFNEDNVYMIRWQGDDGSGYQNANEVYLFEAANQWVDASGMPVAKGTPDATLVLGKPEDFTGSLMAQHISSFDVDLSRLADYKVILNMLFAYEDKTYQIAETIKLRNRVTTEVASMYSTPVVYEWITGITIDPTHADMRRKTSKYFTYNMTGDPEAVAQGVNWSVVKADGSALDPGTYIDSSGKLTIGPSETIGANVLVVNCVSKADPTKSAQATVTVLPGSITSITIDPKDVIVMQTKTQQFTYTMEGTQDAIDEGVTWSVEALDGSVLTGTTGVSSSGLLTVDEAQQVGANILKVTVTSVANTSMSDSAYVTVVPYSVLDYKYNARLIVTTLTTYEYEENGETKIGYKADIECLPNYADYLNGYPKITWSETTNPSVYEIVGNEPADQSQFTSTLYCGGQRNTMAYVQAVVQLDADVAVVVGIDISIPDLQTTVKRDRPYIQSDQFVLNRNGLVTCKIMNYEDEVTWRFEDGMGLTSDDDCERMIGFEFLDGTTSNYDEAHNTRNYYPTYTSKEVDVRAKWCVDWDTEYRLKLQALNDKGTVIAETYIVIPKFDILFTGGEHYVKIKRPEVGIFYEHYYMEVYGFHIGKAQSNSEGNNGGSGDFRLELDAELQTEKERHNRTQIVDLNFNGTSDYVALDVSGDEPNDFLMLRMWDNRRPHSDRTLMFMIED